MEYSKEFLEKEIPLLKKQLKIYRNLLKEINRKEELQHMVDYGFSQEMIDFYSHKVPNSTSDYFCDSFNDDNEISELIRSFINENFDLTRHKTYDWHDLLFEDDCDSFYFEDKELGKKINNHLLLNTNNLSKKDRETFEKLKKIYFSLTTSKFIYDW